MLVRVLLSATVLLFADILLQAQEISANNSLPTPYPAVLTSEAPLQTIEKRVDEVNLLLSVTNHRGGFVRDLNQSDLVISDNGEPPAKITFFQSQTDLPLRVALVVDTSDSVMYRFAFEQKSAHAFLKRVLRPKSDAALVVGFNERPTLVQPLTNDLSKLDQGIRRLEHGGETALYDAIALAADSLRANPEPEPVRRVIVLITDGEENRSHIDLDQAVEHALRAESVIYAVNTKDFVLTEEDKRGDQVIRHLAEETGGTMLFAQSDGDIAASFRKIQAELRSQYALGYRPRNILSGLLFRPVRILGPKGIRIRCRQGYYAH